MTSPSPPSSRLRTYLNLFTLARLPPDSAVPSDLSDPRKLLEALAAAGYQGVQGYEIEVAGVPAADPSLCAELGLGCAAAGVVHHPGTIDRDAERWAGRGFEAATLHVGRGHEDDDVVHRLLDEIVAAADRHGFPLYVETHRATVTQDTWRTVQYTRSHPDIRFNGDFSHWYTGIDVGDGSAAEHPSVAHFEAFWTAAFRGFLTHAGRDDHVVFAPELLPPQIDYARTVPAPAGAGSAAGADGTARVEEGDRWHQALVLNDIARRCYETAAAEAAGSTRSRS